MEDVVVGQGIIGDEAQQRARGKDVEGIGLVVYQWALEKTCAVYGDSHKDHT